MFKHPSALRDRRNALRDEYPIASAMAAIEAKGIVRSLSPRQAQGN